MSNSDDSVRREVDAKVESINEVVRMARVPFAVGTAVAIVWLTALYSHHLGYANNVVSRYETTLMRDDSSICEAPLIARFHPDLFETDHVSLCRKVLEAEFEQWVEQRVRDSVVDISVILTRTTVFDLGVVGNLTLIIVGLWFRLATRREMHALSSIVSTSQRKRGEGHEEARPRFFKSYSIEPQLRNWERADYIEAQQRVAHRFLFLSSTGSLALLSASALVMSLPAFVSMFHAASDWHSVLFHDISVKDVGARLFISTASMFIVGNFYYCAIRNELIVAMLLDGWHLLCREYVDDESGSVEPLSAAVQPRVRAELKPVAATKSES